MSRILVNRLRVRDQPSLNSRVLDYYDSGDIIRSGSQIIFNEGRWWLKYTSSSGYQRYICCYDSNGQAYINVPNIVPGPRPGGPNPVPPSDTGIPGFPKQKQFPNSNIQNWGCCFLCSCVKGGLTDMNHCLDCYNWCLQSGKIRADCWVNIDKEQLARQISQRYNTPYHGDYNFQTNARRNHFWLTQNGREIFNSAGIGRH